MKRRKHRKDGKHGKQGWVGGNPRYGRRRGNGNESARKGTRHRDKQNTRLEIEDERPQPNPVTTVDA